MTIPPSQSALPPTLWPPPRTATRSSFSRAKFTASTTSATPEQRAMIPGCLSMLAFQIRRAVVISRIARTDHFPSESRPKGLDTVIADDVPFGIDQFATRHLFLPFRDTLSRADNHSRKALQTRRSSPAAGSGARLGCGAVRSDTCILTVCRSFSGHFAPILHSNLLTGEFSTRPRYGFDSCSIRPAER